MSSFGREQFLGHLKGSKERSQHLPKREFLRTDWGGNILTGWEGRRMGRGENYILIM